MTVQELIDALSSMDPNAEVRLAIQPSWPFEHRIKAVEMVELEVDPNAPNGVENDPVNVVYIAEGGQMGYLPGEAASACW